MLLVCNTTIWTFTEIKGSVWVNCIYCDCVLSYHFYSLLASLLVVFNFILAAKLYFTTWSLLAQSYVFSDVLRAAVFGGIFSVAFPRRSISSLADCTRSLFTLLSRCLLFLIYTLLFYSSLLRTCFYKLISNLPINFLLLGCFT